MVCILGIDPGVNNIGIAVLDTDTMFVTSWGTLHWTGSYTSLLSELKDYCKEVDVVSIEKPFFTPKTLPNNIRTLEIIGLIKMAAEQQRLKTFQYSPATIKKAFTGSGVADKKDIIKEVTSKFNVKTNITHEADAIAIAYTHYVECSDLYKQ